MNVMASSFRAACWFLPQHDYGALAKFKEQ